MIYSHDEHIAYIDNISLVSIKSLDNLHCGWVDNNYKILTAIGNHTLPAPEMHKQNTKIPKAQTLRMVRFYIKKEMKLNSLFRVR